MASGFARALGCRETASNGSVDQAGATVVGFRVERSEPPSLVVLGGRHRFSRYRLTFEIDAAGPGRSRLTALTDASFPGAAGRVYRALVIGSRVHVVAVRRMLGRIRSLATSA